MRVRQSGWAGVGAVAISLLAALAGACGDDDGQTPGGDSDSGGGGSQDAAPAQDGSAPQDGGGPGPAGGGLWTMLGGDPRSNYYAAGETAITVENAASLESKWIFTVVGYPAGSVAVADGVVYATATGGLYAIDLDTGAEIWKREDLGAISSPAYHDGHVYVHTQRADLYKVNAENGETVWGPVKTYDHPQADGTSSPVIAGGKVMVGHSTTAEIYAVMQAEARGGVFAADLETGEEVWHYFTVDLPENGAMVWSTVSVDEELGMVFATTGNNYTVGGSHSDAIHAIDLEDGTQLWATQVREDDTWVLAGANTGEDTDFGANPIVADHDGQKLVAAGDKGSAFWALDRETGDIVWSYEDLSSSHSANNGGVLNNGAFDGTRFYVASNQPPGAAVLHALDPADGTDVWEPKTLDDIVWGMLTVANGVLFVPVNEELRIFAAETGEQLHTLNTGGTIAAGGAVIAGGRVIVKSGLQYPLGAVTNNNQIHCYGLPD